jgi:hypothetical protein
VPLECIADRPQAGQAREVDQLVAPVVLTASAVRILIGHNTSVSGLGHPPGVGGVPAPPDREQARLRAVGAGRTVGEVLGSGPGLLLVVVRFPRCPSQPRG